MSDRTGPAPGEPEAEAPEPRPEAGASEPQGPEAKIAELEDRWRRALADLDNHRKRTLRALDRERADERARTSAVWLPVLDDLERALEHADAEPGQVIQGVRAVLDHARQVIEHLGYPRRDDEGESFDPARHEAVGVVAGSGVPDGTVVHVVRPGYGEGPDQLRPAQVVVAKEEAAGEDVAEEEGDGPSS